MSDLDYDKAEPANNIVGYSVFVTSILITVIVVASYFMFVAFLSKDQNEKYEFSKTQRLDQLNQSYQKNLNKLDWQNKQMGVVKVPIDVAMDHVVKSYNR